MEENVITEVTVPDDPLLLLDKEERDFIARGIHNFSFKKKEFYDEQRTKDIRAQIVLGLTTQQSMHLFPGSMIENAIDSSTSALGEKKTYWLKRLIKKTSGDTQKLLEGLLYINDLLKKCGAKRASTKKIIKQTDDEPQPQIVEVKMETPLPSVLTPDFFEKHVEVPAPKMPEPVVELPKPQTPKLAPKRLSESSSEEEEVEPRKKKSKKSSKKIKHKKRVKYMSSSDSSSSSSDDDSEDDFHYYYKRLKKPYKAYRSRNRPKVSQRPFATYVPRQNEPTVYAPPIPVELPVPEIKAPVQNHFQPQSQKLDYASHFLGNGRY